MSSIQLSDVRIAGFRGLEDVCFSLNNTTVLTGCNNAGKTSILRALQLALGNSSFLTVDDFFVSSSGVRANEIIVDLRFIPIDDSGNREKEFCEEWAAVFKTFRESDSNGMESFSFRTRFTYSKVKSDFDKDVMSLPEWLPTLDQKWQDIRVNKKFTFDRDCIPFFYIEAQRDIVEDSKLRTSFLGKILAKVAKSYDESDVADIEQKIKILNDSAISKSNVLSRLENILKEIESAIESRESKVKITPFTKKIRDLNKGLTIQYGSDENSFTMDYHGMGTRSWSSLLAFKAFILQNKLASEEDGKVFFPIITVEEPEAHLHPDAQKRLYSQIDEMPGQKIVSTHSPYVAAYAKLKELRNVYKRNDCPVVKSLDVSSLSSEDIRKLEQKVIRTKGEIVFSKALVLFEGETEEQALPILAKKFFGQDPTLLGIDFIGVGGCGNYLPFLRLAKAFEIPWYIFSDGEDQPQRNIKKAMAALNGVDVNLVELSSYDNIFVIGGGADFEKMLINEGYVDEIKMALKKIMRDENCVTSFISGRNGQKKQKGQDCPFCHRNIKPEILYHYTLPDDEKDVLDAMMADQKTSFAPEIADVLRLSKKELPLLVKQMFEKIKREMSL